VDARRSDAVRLTMRMTMPARPVFWLGINPRPVPSRHRQWHLPARSPSQRWARHGIQPCSRFSRQSICSQVESLGVAECG